MDLVNNPVVQGIAIVFGGLGIGYKIFRDWKAEQAATAAKKEQAKAELPEILKHLLVNKTPMPALAADLDIQNNLLLAIEKLTARVNALTTKFSDEKMLTEVAKISFEVSEMRREMRERQIRDEAFRDGESRARR